MRLRVESESEKRFGYQRDWRWHGWRIHYTFYPPLQANNPFVSPPILLLHGFGVSLRHWRHNIPILRQRHFVYALDLLGFGASEKTYTEYGIPLWSRLVFDFWQEFISQPCILIGNSLGSLIALNTTASYPDTVKGLVMLSLPDLRGKRDDNNPILTPLLHKIEELFTFPLLIRLIFQIAKQKTVISNGLKIAYVNQNNLDEELIEIVTKPTEDVGAARALIAMTKSINKFPVSVRQLLESINIPILLLWGKGDKLIPPTKASHLAAINTNIELHLLDKIGHCIHDENPDLFHKILFSWLKRNNLT
ncbi:MAG: alpha/beta fold hydrolase [Geminocystis sp.]|nr:alpha/beta fold hydrolase [Geminocystis sp.]